MIVKNDMMPMIIEVSPGFAPVWDACLELVEEDGYLPIYSGLAALARYIASLVATDSGDELKAVFSVVERWHLEGNLYVREAATIGLLEDLQNTNVVGKDIPEKVEAYLLSETGKWWVKVYEFWEGGKPIG